MAKQERGWHCAFTHACVYETTSAGYRVPGTNLICCGPHVRQMEMQRFSGGRAGAEAVAGMLRSAHGRNSKAAQ